MRGEWVQRVEATIVFSADQNVTLSGGILHILEFLPNLAIDEVFYFIFFLSMLLFVVHFCDFQR